MANRYHPSGRFGVEAEVPDHLVAPTGRGTGEALSQALTALERAFAGSKLTVTDAMADTDHIALRFAMNARQDGKGRDVTEGILIYRIAEGRIAEHWLQPGMPDLAQDLGSAPLPV